MKWLPVTAWGALLVLTGNAFAQAPNERPIVVVDGVLSHYHDVIWQLRIPASHKIHVAGRSVDTIRIAVDAFAAATWGHKYDGSDVEVSGKIDTSASDLLNHGVAKMTLYSMTLGDHRQTSPVETLRALAAHEPDPNTHAPGQPLYRFAYYLVLLDAPKDCERCYVPLLISPEPIELVARNKGSLSVVSITTYERDSIWQHNGLALITSDAIEQSSRTIHFRGRNYRYESEPDPVILHLLEHPSGTIPISRPLLPQTEAPGASISDLIADFHTIFRVRERPTGWQNAVSPVLSTPSPDSTAGMSELTIFDDGRVEYRLTPGCTNNRDPSEAQKWRETAENWNWRETCPGSQRREESFDYSLKTSEFAQLKELLSREDVKGWRDCFCNAAMGLGDYNIEIARQDSTQRIPIVGFMPQHIELRENPALTRLVCEARIISAQVAKQPPPPWCSDLPALDTR
jgi:hypothetical protein